ncbi:MULTISPECIES: tyrosine-type recombinase/integrase [Arcobacteraceae]|uniref:Site-specific integrase n=2 Tax=Arcobacteraceae TaxID=2808963 RepID=A0AAW7PV52_9BACT|nr:MULTISPECIES: site-specific integrase [Arcobacteraceae]MCG3668342.1 site-specific integrase [Aliarcobacter butzleri]MCT7608338.1 site-specific integrase [Aliarcobacter butzleri]MDN5069861.1 site-specific integrase [Aliarcobacter butzleri]QKF77369.1 site-specific tyrosine recombinase, phage integrase family (INT_Rci_Hp1_C domain) [Arcobacter defluvii]RXI29056.1 integrase [Arcobacter defluvii]
MIKTNLTGIYFRETTTNDKIDKTYYITYKNEQNKKVWQKIGKYSEGIREAYCNQKRNEILTKQRNGEEPPVIAQKKKRNVLSIETIANEYFTLRKDGKSKLTDKSHFTHYILPYFKNLDFENITKDEIQKFTFQLKKTKSVLKKELLADKSINNILNFLKALIKYAFKNDFIKNDFSKYIILLDIDNARERFLTKEEIETLYENSKDDETLFLLFNLALKTGGRLETLLNIQKKDIDFSHNLLTLKDFKNNSTYKAFLTDDLKSLLEKKVVDLKLNDQLFPSNPERRLRKILDELFNEGIDFNDRKNKIVFHSLRHTFASHLAIIGTPIFTIQKLMNHKDIRMTLRYAKLAPDSGKAFVEKLPF